MFIIDAVSSSAKTFDSCFSFDVVFVTTLLHGDNLDHASNFGELAIFKVTLELHFCLFFFLSFLNAECWNLLLPSSCLCDWPLCACICFMLICPPFSHECTFFTCAVSAFVHSSHVQFLLWIIEADAARQNLPPPPPLSSAPFLKKKVFFMFFL